MADFHIQALRYARQGDWDASHELVQDYSDEFSCLIHGYLHRVEGDMFNARYWYKRAGHTLPANTLAEELSRLEILLSTS